MLHELDVVALTVELSGQNLTKGNVGTIVDVYGTDVFEVEFVDDAERTYELEALGDEQLLRLQFTSSVTNTEI